MGAAVGSVQSRVEEASVTLINPPATDAEARLRTADAVAKMAAAIDAGTCEPTTDELKALATVCDEHHLHVEAARIRRWMGL